MGDRLTWAKARFIVETTHGFVLEYTFPNPLEVDVVYDILSGAEHYYGNGISSRDPDRVDGVTITIHTRRNDADYLYMVRRIDQDLHVCCRDGAVLAEPAEDDTVDGPEPDHD